MKITYWYAFFAGRAAQSLFGCVTTISGAMGLFNSQIIKEVVEKSYYNQHFCKVKCVFGEDRHLTSGLIEEQTAVLFDYKAIANTESPTTINKLIMQQTRWYKGFYRECFVFLPRYYDYDLWSVLALSYAFFIPFLVVINLFAVMILDVNKIALFILYVFIITLALTFRALLRTGRLIFLHALWHPFFFFFFLLPCKLWAFFSILLCVPDQYGAGKTWIRVIHVYIWIIVAGGVFIGMGIVFNFAHDHENMFNYNIFILMIIGIVLLLLVIHWLTWGWTIYVPKKKEKLTRMLYGSEQTDVEGSTKTLKLPKDLYSETS